MKKLILTASIIVGTLATVQEVNYLNFKKEVINQWGQDGYRVINQEAGIDNELESRIHYLIYNK